MNYIKENKVFLGGTCNNSGWRDQLMPLLNISYFNPVVEDWTPDCQEEEYRQKAISKWQLYVITPLMKGCFSIAEAVDGSNKDPKHTIFCILDNYDNLSFEKHEIKSLNATYELIKNNGAFVCRSLDEVANILNNI